MDNADVLWTSYFGFGVICTVAELAHPARKVRYAKALPLDIVAFLVFQFAVFPLATYVTDPLLSYVPRAHVLLDVPMALRVVAFYLVADLGSYWVHRLIHTRHLWRIHRWHHSTERLWWLSGVRTTVPQQILFNLPFVVAVPLLIGIPTWLFLAILVEGIARNHWMHMNVAWRSRWLELVLVTPRYHHIHHATDADLHHGNFGALFTFWDRLFGSYVDPDVATPKLFGTGERKRDPVLLMIGI